MKKEINKRMLVGIRAARSAGKVLSTYYKKVKKLKIKNNLPRDIISKVDLMSENEIYKIVNKTFKNDSFLGEEKGLIKKRVYNSTNVYTKDLYAFHNTNLYSQQTLKDFQNKMADIPEDF